MINRAVPHPSTGAATLGATRVGRHLWLLGVVILAPLNWCGAQEPNQKETAKAAVNVMNIGSSAGVRRYSVGEWGLVGAELSNTTDEDGTIFVGSYFDGAPNLQYGREVWVPARSKRMVVIPVRPPESLPVKADSIAIKSIVLDRSQSGDVLVRNPHGELQYSNLLALEPLPLLTAMISDADGGANPTPGTNEVFEAIVAFRFVKNLPRRIPGMHDAFLPPIHEALNAADQLVMANDRVANDAAGLSALRRWLFGGGRLWIMLDQVQPETIEKLLGDQFECQVVDRVGLNDFQIERVGIKGDRGDPREFENPVEFVRVVPQGVDVVNTVNGWPAAFWMTTGNGKILFTTLGPRAWMRPREASDPSPRVPNEFSNFVATAPLKRLADEFFVRRATALLEPDDLAGYLEDQIGYEIVGRTPVIVVLAGFCAVLLLAGLVLVRKKRLEQLLWLGPLAACCACVPLLLLGMRSRQTVPATVAMAQFVEVDTGIDGTRVSGLLAFYNQEATEYPLGARRGGLFQPLGTDASLQTRRMVWTDLDHWHWENLELPPGVTFADFESTVRLPTPVEARGTFDEAGYTGHLQAADMTGVSDALIAMPAHWKAGVQLNDDLSFVSGPTDVLAREQVSSATLLSDEQRRRQQVVRALLSPTREEPYPQRPTMLFWADPLDLKFDLPPDSTQTGSALVAVPIKIDRPEAGTRVTIPSPFLSSRSVPAPDGQGMSPSYNYRTGDWQPMRPASKTYLRFQLPPEVLPVRLDHAKLTLKISAPLRMLKLATGRLENVVSLAERESAVGTFDYEINDPQALELDAQGGLHVLLDVSDVIKTNDEPSGGGDDVFVDNTWKVDYVQLQVTGEALNANQR